MALFEKAAPEQEAEEESQHVVAAKRRTKLFPYDSVAAQLLEPHGTSSVDKMSLAELWASTAKGNKRAMYHSHLAADQEEDAWHVGAGISMTAASLQLAFTAIKGESMTQLMRPELHQKVMTEITDLEPHVQVLNLGKGSQAQPDTGSFRAAKRRKGTEAAEVAATPTEAELRAAAKALHAWLSKPKSPLRHLLDILSASNVFYTGHVAEMVARAAIEFKPMSAEQFAAAIAARARKPSATERRAAATSSNTGLFE